MDSIPKDRETLRTVSGPRDRQGSSDVKGKAELRGPHRGLLARQGPYTQHGCNMS